MRSPENSGAGADIGEHSTMFSTGARGTHLLFVVPVLFRGEEIQCGTQKC